MTRIITKSTCPYCGVGCGVETEVVNGNLTCIKGDGGHPANAGKLCVKGSRLRETQPDAGQVMSPRVANNEVSWHDALDYVASGLSNTIDQFGPDAVAFYLSGQLLTEDYYVANKLMKGFIGSANVDTNSRLCMASAVAAHQRAFGEDVVPVDYGDLDLADLVVLVGSNAAWTHPILYQRMQAARLRGTKFVVIDPRRTATTEIAHLHLPIKPGSDVALFNGLLCYLNDRDLLDQEFITNHASGFAETLQSARTSQVAETGLDQDLLAQFYEMVAESKGWISFFSQGVNQSANGTDKANAIINAHLAKGAIGKPGAGPFSITGQPNAMGGREVGGLSSQLAAHMGFDEISRDKVSRFWGTQNLASTPGLKAVDLFDRVRSGDIKAIWIMATNPVVSLPRSKKVAEALAACPLVIVSDCVQSTDTSRFAEVFLPAAGWGEKDGTVTNSERVISRQRSFMPTRANVRADWQIVCDVAKRMGFTSAFDYRQVSDIFAEHAALSGFENGGERLFDIAKYKGISKSEYDALAPFQWPLEKPFTNKQFPTASGRANFVPVSDCQIVPAKNQYILNSGRVRDQWHTMTRTGFDRQLQQHAPEPRVQINDQDASSIGVQSGDLVQLTNREGMARLIAEVTGDVLPGQLFVPMHWSQAFAYPCRINDLMPTTTDPVSGQPASKSGLVQLQKVIASTWVRMQLTRDVACPDDVVFRFTTPVEGGWFSEMALSQAVELPKLLKSLGTSASMEYTDQRSGTGLALLDEQGHGRGVISIAADRRSLLPMPDLAHLGEAGASSVETLLGTGDRDCSPQICTCFEVREASIQAAIANGRDSVDALGETLGCGTNCGSCVPELKALLLKYGQAIQESANG